MLFLNTGKAYGGNAGGTTDTIVHFDYPKPYGRASFLDPVAEF